MTATSVGAVGSDFEESTGETALATHNAPAAIAPPRMKAPAIDGAEAVESSMLRVRTAQINRNAPSAPAAGRHSTASVDRSATAPTTTGTPSVPNRPSIRPAA